MANFSLCEHLPNTFNTARIALGVMLLYKFPAFNESVGYAASANRRDESVVNERSAVKKIFAVIY